jgi:5'(3')-deoxyribonucleotidase
MTNGSKPVIAVDLDDVLAIHVEEFIAFSNKTFGTNLTIEEYNDHWGEMWQIDHEEAEKRAQLWRTPDRVANFRKPDVDPSYVLEQLIKRFDLVIATARPSVWNDSTVEWVNKQYPNIFKDVRLVPVWTGVKRQTKAEVCHEIGARYLIDDLPDNCEIAATAGIECLLFGDYPWNRQAELVPGMTRVANWDAVLEYFDERA